MTKSLLTLTLFAMMAGVTQAQYLGLKGGLTFSNLNLDEVNDRNLRTGYHAGAYLNLPLGTVFAFQPEVNYTTKGATAEYDFTLFRGEQSFNLNYFDIPLMGVIRLGNAAEIHLGPYIGFLSKASISTDGEFFEDGRELDRDSFRSMDYGLAAGFALNFDAIQLGARYHFGLQEIADNNASRAFLGDARHSYLQVYAALRLGNYTY